jgi:hypothetical protein
MPAAVRTSMRVPELTACAAIKLNRRLSLRHPFFALLIRPVQFFSVRACDGKAIRRAYSAGPVVCLALPFKGFLT